VKMGQSQFLRPLIMWNYFMEHRLLWLPGEGVRLDVKVVKVNSWKRVISFLWKSYQAYASESATRSDEGIDYLYRFKLPNSNNQKGCQCPNWFIDAGIDARAAGPNIIKLWTSMMN
jgi:hypothetical protein